MFKYILVSVASIFTPALPVLMTVLVLILIDLITGVIAALKRDEDITSAALRRTVTKIFVYEIAIITSFLIEMYLINQGLPLMKLTSGIIATVEGLSVYENLNTIYGSNLFKKIINILGSPNDTGPKK